ncbi:glycosyltransferase family 2 protein [Xenorhabdus ehlersii]|uniref:Glycosyl transferase, group 2 family protein n=1 Tax=Xenorhabdus ehlersii TaxID=290111 RepID=A0A2D0IK22_9GAMM|nr:glycosyltransferase family 2 protein [Xenorhabdus ehlersii]PHM22112.1 glycosyl transferase, group 2 family protein [Xenorhabdus ehlersii]RKE93329.1 glycosyltransferase involved in cell wall biosynthesis [Xenorhabdus ehlersii]
MDKVSVIIPAYNAQETILNALSSVYMQQGKYDIEIIVVDDGSFDNTAQLVSNFSKKHPGYIKLITKKNQGVASARNDGINNATGEFIAFLDSDDCWYPDKLRKQIPILKKHGISLVGGGYHGNFQDLPTESGYFEISYDMQLRKQYFQPSTVIFKREILTHVPGFTEGRRYCEDALFFHMTCYYYRCAIITDDVIKYGDGKHPYASDNGLGSHIWEMEKGELLNFRILYTEKKLSLCKCIFLSLYSFLKFGRRVIIKYFIYYPKKVPGEANEK